MAVHELRSNPGAYRVRNMYPDAMIIRSHDRDEPRGAVTVFDRTDDAIGHWSAPCTNMGDGILKWNNMAK